jgi:HAD superfamily hydrolase (TIGR01509 family)
MIAAFIFDWDGVIVDSSELHKNSWEALADELHLALPQDHFQRGFGKRNETIIPEILNWTKEKNLIDKWGKRKEEIYREMGKSGGIYLQSGVINFLEQAKKYGIPCSVGTSTEKKNVLLAMEQHRIEDFFKLIVASEDVIEGKPNPEVFQKASYRLGHQPASCLVFEDSPHGIEAAKRGGMRSVALTTSHPAETFQQLKPDVIAATFDELRMDNLLALFQ